MASLTETSILARKGVRYGIYAIILIFILRYAFLGAVALYKRLFPPAPPKPTVAFGKLPEIPFPPKESPQNLTYVVETPNGKLPVFPDQIEVYSMPQAEPSISALDLAKKTAQSLGFNPDGKVIAETIPNVYLFGKGNIPSTLTMNIVTGIFSISYDIASDTTVLQGIPPNDESAIANVRSLIDNLLTKDDLNGARYVHEYLRVEGGKFVPADSLSDANVTKVNVFRKGFSKDNSVPAVTPEMPEANIWFTMGAGRGKQVIAAEFHYYPLDTKKTATYPVKTAQTALGELESGKGFIANSLPGLSGQVFIRRIYLAYYDAGLYVPYYQPVVVFEGDDGFFAYVPAITDEYYQEVGGN